jgi:hypothetical protein
MTHKKVFWRSLAAWLVIVLFESTNGTIREMLLVPRWGETTARQISFGSAMVLIFVISLLMIRWINAHNAGTLMLIGLFWIALTLIFEVIIGRLMGMSWYKILSDYDPLQGGLMAYGLVYLGCMPLITARLRGLFPSAKDPTGT